MQSNPRSRNRARRRRKGQLWVCATLLLLICVLLLLVKCAGKQENKGEAEKKGAVGTASAPPASETAVTLPADLPEGWTASDLGDYGLRHGQLVLVNAAHGFDPDGVTAVSVWENKNLSFLVKDVYLSVDPQVMDRLNEWMAAFDEATGLTNINVIAGYRSYDDQQYLYDNAVRTKGQDHADRYLALPGHSEHHTGLAVDLDIFDAETGTSRDFDGAGDYAWAKEHAWEFGFVQRYPNRKSDITGIDYESWHYRYVGQVHAYWMEQKGFCLEEYIDYLRGFPYDGAHLFVDCAGVRYEIYYCPGTVAVVPEDGLYTVSGNNVDGLIVTLTLE